MRSHKVRIKCFKMTPTRMLKMFCFFRRYILFAKLDLTNCPVFSRPTDSLPASFTVNCVHSQSVRQIRTNTWNVYDWLAELANKCQVVRLKNYLIRTHIFFKIVNFNAIFHPTTKQQHWPKLFTVFLNTNL